MPDCVALTFERIGRAIDWTCKVAQEIDIDAATERTLIDGDTHRVRRGRKSIICVAIGRRRGVRLGGGIRPHCPTWYNKWWTLIIRHFRGTVRTMNDTPLDTFPLAGKRIWVAGHKGMVGAALLRRLANEPCQLLTVDRADLDLTRQAETEAWIAAAKPDAIVIAAAKVGGILANDTRPAEFLYENLAIEANILHAAWRTGVAKVLFLGSSCIYPKHAEQPIAEEALLTGPLEPTNEWYAIAKIAGIKLCQAYRKQFGSNFISAQPTNLYGPFDNFDLMSSHVFPALIAKAHHAARIDAPTLQVWGTGRPLREFLHVDDLADALVFLLQRYAGPIPINVGSGEERTIGALAEIIAERVGFRGTIVFDPSKPDGTPRKRLDSRRLTQMGWTPRIALRDGIDSTYRWYVEHYGRGGSGDA